MLPLLAGVGVGGTILSLIIAFGPAILSSILSRQQAVVPGHVGTTAAAYAQARAISNVNLNPLIEALSGIDGSLVTAMGLLARFHAQGLIANAVATSLTLYMGRDAVRELRRIGGYLQRIATAMESKLSFGEPFPQHIFNFVKAEMSKSEVSGSDIKHLFFVFNPGTEWHPRFDALRREDPLPEGFCGYYNNLEVLCGILRRVTRPAVGPQPVFHLLIPSLGPFVLAEPVVFPNDIGKLVIKGELNTTAMGCPYVWLNIARRYKDLVLENVGQVRDPESWKETAAGVSSLGTFAVMGGASMLSTAALAPVLGPVCVVWFVATGVGSMFAAENVSNVVMRSEYWDAEPRVLGSTFDGGICV